MKRVELMPFSKIEPRHGEETLVRLTPQGERLAAQLAAQSPRERERTMRLIMERVRQAKKEEAEQRKRTILDVLRSEVDEDSDGRFILLEKICDVLDVPVIEAVLLLHEINGDRLDVPEGEMYVYCFFNHGSGQVYVELWEPEGGEGAR